MCVACLSVRDLYNSSIIKAKNLEDAAYESKLRESREWFLREIFEQDHNAATNLLLKSKSDGIAKDSDVLNGRRWEDILEESFKKQAETESQTSFDFGTNTESKVTSEILNESQDLAQKAYCPHDYFEYQGAGTRAPEIICRTCGSLKPSR